MKSKQKIVFLCISICTLVIILVAAMILFLNQDQIQNDDWNFTESNPQTSTHFSRFSVQMRFYNGSSVNGMKHGKGIFEDKNSSTIYDGDFLNDKLEGVGNNTADFDYDNQEIDLKEPFQLIDKRIWKYSGYFKEGQLHGNGSLWFHGGNHLYQDSFYVGGLENGVLEGNGTLCYKGNQSLFRNKTMVLEYPEGGSVGGLTTYRKGKL